MKTDALIAALAADHTERTPAPQRLLWAGLAGAFVMAAIAFFVFLYPRAHFLQAIQTVRFDFKFVVTLALVASAFVALRHAMRPEMGDQPLKLVLWTAPALLAIAVVLELIAVPSAEWVTRWFGHYWLFCMTFIPILSLGPLVVLLFTLRMGASTAPAKTGALAGLLAGGIGAVFYAAHCPDDSPLFVASWYTISVGMMAGLGALGGWRLLRW